MRWPLRNQIIFPLAVVMALTMVGLVTVNFWVTTTQTKRDIEQRLADGAQTLASSTFPLTDRVLQQTSGLSGAQFAIADDSGEIQFTSGLDIVELPSAPAIRDYSQIRLDQKTTIDDVQFFYVAVWLDRRAVGRESVVLHMFYPEVKWQEATWQNLRPSWLIGVVALLLFGTLSTMIAARVTRPIARLKEQVSLISHGDFQPMPLPRRNDEIRDLGASINRMSEMLIQYQEQIRRSERLRTLGQLGGGIAHQMRNAATGCRMAIDLHRQSCPAGERNEELDVATRQLEIMERYLSRFLTLGKTAPAEKRSVDVSALIENVCSLVRPTANHLQVVLEFRDPGVSTMLNGDEDELQQLMVNLILNGIEAVTDRDDGRVVITVDSRDDKQVLLKVEDNGPGPPGDVADEMFDPLVSGKRDGAGLGLAIVRDVVEDHQGQVSWQRQNGLTSFLVQLPRDLIEEEKAHGSVVDR